MSMFGDQLAEAHYAKTQEDCGICANCMTRLRWYSMYQKYLTDTGERADVKWVAKMIKTDNRVLVCLRKLGVTK